MLIIAPPGERKSAVFSAMTATINNFVKEYNALHLIDVQTYFNFKKMLDSKLSKAVEKREDSSVIRDIKMEINALQSVKKMKLITTDVTAEALAAIMSDNNDCKYPHTVTPAKAAIYRYKNVTSRLGNH